MTDLDFIASLDDWPVFAVTVFAIFLARYIVFPGLAYLIIYRWKPDSFRHRKIQAETPQASDILRDIFLSVVSFVVFSVVIVLCFIAFHHGKTSIYTDYREHSGFYFAASIFIMIFMHDTYFYWMHRALHWRWIYRYVHKLHHRTKMPTPWTSFAFHPLEALLEVSIVPLVVFTLPAHPLAISIFLLYMTIINVFGHLGYELFSRWYVTHWFTHISNTATHHDMHHRYGRGNYSLYFNLWDRWMGTNHPMYPELFCTITSEQAPPAKHCHPP